VAGTLVGCSGCMLAIESLASDGNSSMHLMTFATFITITVDGLFRQNLFFKPRHISYRAYAEVVTIFFIVSIASNQAVNFDVPFPLFIIFRSGTLLANVILTRIIQRRVYAWSRLFSVALVTAGIALFTIQERKLGHGVVPKVPPFWTEFVPMPLFFIGVLLMSACLFGSAYMGLLQEKIYSKYGRYPHEMMFYTHFLSLPLFAVVGQSIMEDVATFSNSRPVSVFGWLELPIPSQWLMLLLVVSLQLICIRNVYNLSAQMTSLNLTMILTLRKFLNLLLSFVIFNNPFSAWHALAASMVFIGSFQFYDGFTILFKKLQVRYYSYSSSRKYMKNE
jgi:UDP-xylose/UDP-N-acetylglucosamine transporter B4